MHLNTGNTRLSVALLVAAGLAAGGVSAETLKTVNGASIDSAVLDFYIESRTRQPASQASPELRENALQQLTDIYLLSTQDVAAELRKDPKLQAQLELQTRGALAQAVASRFLESVEVTDEEVAAEYAAQTELAPPMQYKARHILVDTQGKAQELIGRLDDGANFEELAKSESTGPSGPRGGDLGWFSPNQMVPPFSAAVAGLEDGSYSAEPVQTEFGWHVILREDSREQEAPPLDTVRDQIVQRLQQMKFEAYLNELRAAADAG